MTDKKTDTSQDDRARSQTPVLTTPSSKRVPPNEGAPGASGKSGGGSRSLLAPAALVLALIAAGLSVAVWQQQKQAQETQVKLVSRLAGQESQAGQSASQMQALLTRIERQEGEIKTLQGQLGDATAVIRDLDEALRIMTDRGSELVLLNDIDHLVTIAQQQLQLGGNVRNAIVALESAQAQLARANRPSLAMLMQTLNGDLDRLRAASTIDIAAFSSQLEELALLVTEAPLIMPDAAARVQEPGAAEPTREHPAPTSPPASSQSDVWWERAWDKTRELSNTAWRSLREDLGQFIDVRRVDDSAALLMSPDQAQRFRDNLRTRIMTAQLALMMRQPEVWKTETEAVVKAIETRFEESSPMTRKALRIARNMADTPIDATLPTVDNTLHALAALREEQSKELGGTDGAAGESAAQSGEGAANDDEPAQVEGSANSDSTATGVTAAGNGAAGNTESDNGAASGTEAGKAPESAGSSQAETENPEPSADESRGPEPAQAEPDSAQTDSKGAASGKSADELVGS